MFILTCYKNYCGEVYTAEFRMNRTQYRRQHQAVITAINNLGVDILFPKQITMKNPQINFVLSDSRKNKKNMVIQRPPRKVTPAKGLGKKYECDLEETAREVALGHGHTRKQIINIEFS
jgi:hypothetical protein